MRIECVAIARSAAVIGRGWELDDGLASRLVVDDATLFPVGFLAGFLAGFAFGFWEADFFAVVFFAAAVRAVVFFAGLEDRFPAVFFFAPAFVGADLRMAAFFDVFSAGFFAAFFFDVAFFGLGFFEVAFLLALRGEPFFFGVDVLRADFLFVVIDRRGFGRLGRASQRICRQSQHPDLGGILSAGSTAAAMAGAAEPALRQSAARV